MSAKIVFDDGHGVYTVELPEDVECLAGVLRQLVTPVLKAAGFQMDKVMDMYDYEGDVLTHNEFTVAKYGLDVGATADDY